MDQDLSQLPPAFRRILLAMVPNKTPRSRREAPSRQRSNSVDVGKYSSRHGQPYSRRTSLEWGAIQKKRYSEPIPPSPLRKKDIASYETAMQKGGEHPLPGVMQRKFFDEPIPPSPSRKKDIARYDPAVHKGGERPLPGTIQRKCSDEPIPSSPSRKNDHDRYEELHGALPVAERKKRWTSKGKAEVADKVEGKIMFQVQSTTEESAKDKDSFTEVYAQHGIVQYLRPDGHGNAARMKVRKPNEHFDEEAVLAIAELVAKIDPLRLKATTRF